MQSMVLFSGINQMQREIYSRLPLTSSNTNKTNLSARVVAHACNSSTEVKKIFKFKVSLGSIVRPYLLK